MSQEFRLKEINETKITSSQKQSKMSWWMKNTKTFPQL